MKILYVNQPARFSTYPMEYPDRLRIFIHNDDRYSFPGRGISALTYGAELIIDYIWAEDQFKWTKTRSTTSLAKLVRLLFEVKINEMGEWIDPSDKVMFYLKYQTPLNEVKEFSIEQTFEELREYGSTVQNS